MNHRRLLCLPPKASNLRHSIRFLLKACLIIIPKTLNILPKQVLPEAFLVILLSSQVVINLAHTTFAKFRFQEVEEVGRILIACVPFASSLLLPMRRSQVAAQADEVGNAFDKAAWTGAMAVPLPAAITDELWLQILVR